MSLYLSISIWQVYIYFNILELILSCRIYQIAFKKTMHTPTISHEALLMMNCFTKNVNNFCSKCRTTFYFWRFTVSCILDRTPVWSDCIWELPVCHQLRRRQPQSQDQRDPGEPLQQLRLPCGDTGRPGCCTACVPPEEATSRYSLKKAQSSLTINSSVPCWLMTFTFALLLCLCPSLLA